MNYLISASSITLWCPHFTDRKPEAQRGEVTAQGHGRPVAASDLKPRSPPWAHTPSPAPPSWLEGPVQHRHVTALLTSLPRFPTTLRTKPASKPSMGGQLPASYAGCPPRVHILLRTLGPLGGACASGPCSCPSSASLMDPSHPSGPISSITDSEKPSLTAAHGGASLPQATTELDCWALSHPILISPGSPQTWVGSVLGAAEGRIAPALTHPLSWRPRMQSPGSWGQGTSPAWVTPAQEAPCMPVLLPIQPHPLCSVVQLGDHPPTPGQSGPAPEGSLA